MLFRPSRVPKAAAPLRHAGRSGRAALRDVRVDGRTLLLMAMAGAVGGAATLAARLLLALIALVTGFAWHGRLSFSSSIMDPGVFGYAAILIPAAGGLLVGLMARFGSEKIRGHGIPEAMEAILIGQSQIQPRVAVLKPLSSALSIGTGGPFGAEGPIIMTGGAIGSLFAQCFRLTAAERKTLLVAGAAAGMTAIFATPLAALLLALEILLFEWKARSFLPVMMACGVAAAARPLLFDPAPLFALAPQAIPVNEIAAHGIPAAIAIGLAAGLLSSLLTALVYGMEDLFACTRLHWMWWPAIGGLCVGVGGLIDPAALGVGYGNIRDLLAGTMNSDAALLLLVVKGVVWALALGSGTSGGVLAPVLMIGGALGSLMAQVLPHHGGQEALFALMGMAATMSGTMRAPLTATLFAVEVTGALPPILLVLVACGTSYAITALAMRRSILTEKIARRGLHILQEYGLDPFASLRVGALMMRAVDTLPAGSSVAEAIAFFSAAQRRHKGYPVVDEAGVCVGIITRGDILRWSRDPSQADRGLAEILSERDLFASFPDELAGDLADRMIEADYARVPVLDPVSGRLLGLMTRKDLLAVRAVVLREEGVRAAILRRSA